MTAEPPVAVSWLEQQLQQALARVEALTREVTLLREAVRGRQQEAERMHESLAIVEGRTLRHEAVQDASRSLRQEFGALTERLDQEAALRRDQGSEVRRGIEAERGEQQRARQALERFEQRIATVEQGLASAAERQRHLSGNLGDRAREEQTLEVGLAEAAQRVEALAGLTRREAERHTRALEVVPGLQASAEALEARMLALLQEQRRLEQELATLRAEHEEERPIEEFTQQVRDLRERVEERLGGFERRLTPVLEAQAAADEARALLARQLAAIEQRITVLAASFEGQREALLDHFRRDAVVANELARRQIEELERQTRARRDLLVRLAEASDEATREQPL